MNTPIENERFRAALDTALAHTLPVPELPADFSARLQVALTQDSDIDRAARLRELAAERARQLEAMHEDFVRLRRRTLATWIAVAFTAGAVLTAAMPFISDTFGSYATYLVLPGLGAAIGIAIALTAWLGRSGSIRE